MLRNRILKKIRMADRGNNFWDAPEDLADGEASLTKNCYWRRGIRKRYGSQLHSTNEIASGKFVSGLHRFYYGTSSKKLIAAAGTVVSQLDEPNTWTTIRTGQTDASIYHMCTWAAVNKMYVANGVDVPFSIDSSLNDTDVADGGTTIPADVKMFRPYRDRLLAISTTNPSYLKWTDSYDDSAMIADAQAIRVPGPGPIESITLHSLSGTDTGLDAMILVAKQSSLYLFSGLDLDPASGSFDARLDPIGGGDNVGCVAPRTIVQTPKGSIFLGNDRQVYLLPYESSFIIPIGYKIQHQLGGDGTIPYSLVDIPLAQMSQSCAIYHDGFYKLSFPYSSTRGNTVQYWLDIGRMYVDDKGHYGPWYGPMEGNDAGIFVHQNGAADNGLLLIGDQGSHGYVYSVDIPTIYRDAGTDIDMQLRTRGEALVDPGLDARVTQSELEMLSPTGSVSITLFDTNGSIGPSTSLSVASVGSYWDTGKKWDDGSMWSPSGQPTRQKVQYYDKNLIGRYIATDIEYSNNSDYHIYSIVHEAKPMEKTFGVKGGT